MAMSRTRRLLGRFNILVAAILALAIWIVVSVIGNRPEYKLLWDVSPQAQFSVTAETERLLRELRDADRTVTIDTFYAPLPRPVNASHAHQINIQRRIQELTTDLLRRYQDLGGDALVVRHHDLVRDVGGTRARIEELGGLRNQNSVVVSLGKRHKELSLELDLADISFPSAQQVRAPGAQPGYARLRTYKGEEAISSTIRSLLVAGSPKVYFVNQYGAADLTRPTGSSYSELVGALADDGFEVAALDLEKRGRVPDDAAVVALMEPRKDEMSEQAAAALFDYLRRGGRLVVNFSFSPIDTWNPRFEVLGRLLGFEIGQELVAHLVPDPSLPANSPGVGGQKAQHVVVQSMPPRHPVTQPLVQGRRYPVLSACREVRSLGEGAPQGASVDTGFLQSGPWAWLIPPDPRTGDVDLRAPGRREAYGVRSIGALIDVSPAAGAAGTGGRTGHAAILGGMAFFNDAFQHNGDLALNLFNWMAERQELVTIRGNRYQSTRIELAPQQLDRIENLLQLWTPGLLLALGLVVFFVRSRA